MKKIFSSVFIACFLFAATVNAQQVTMPAPSPVQTIKQAFGLGSVELTYSRPNAKGRKVFGDLVPFGQLWRTGANAATRIRFTESVEMGGKKIDTGSYVFYAIPNATEWEIVINKGLTNWGIDGYKEADDVVRFKVPAMPLGMHVETFTMQFGNIAPESCDLMIYWEKTMVAVNIKTSIKEKVKAQIERNLGGLNWQAAQFYFEYEKNNAKALEAINNAIGGNPKAFWMWHYKARIQKEMGDKKGAKETALKSIELARDAKNDDYVRLNEKLIADLK